jgi:hypothetical protein
MEFWLFILTLILIPLYFSIKGLIRNYKLAFVNPIGNRKNAITWFVLTVILSVILFVALVFIIAFLYFASTIQC